jgi:hypothetical protein
VIITVSALGKDTTTRHSSLVSRDFSRTLVVYPNGAFKAGFPSFPMVYFVLIVDLLPIARK